MACTIYLLDTYKQGVTIRESIESEGCLRDNRNARP